MYIYINIHMWPSARCRRPARPASRGGTPARVPGIELKPCVSHACSSSYHVPDRLEFASVLKISIWENGSRPWEHGTL